MTVPGDPAQTAAGLRWWRQEEALWRYISGRSKGWRPPPEQLEKREATVPVKVKGTSATTGRTVTVAVTVRKVSDARLWESFTSDEEWAAMRIRDAFEMLDRGLGTKSGASETGGMFSGSTGRGIAFTTRVVEYFEWGKECVRQRVDHSAIMDVLGYGKSCRETDSARRKRKGYTREQLREGLELYLAQNGRPTRSEVA